jgi:hypothetical protein
VAPYTIASNADAIRSRLAASMASPALLHARRARDAVGKLANREARAGAVRRAAARDDSGGVVQLSALDLIVIALEFEAFQDVVQEEIGRHAEIILDRRRAERRHAASTTPEERRRGDRRVLDIDEPLRVAGWVLIPADQRPASRDSDHA